MSRTLAHAPALRTDDVARRAQRRPRYSDTRAGARRAALALILDQLDD